MQAELPWPSGPVENPLRIDPEGHPKVIFSSDLLSHHPKSNFEVIYVIYWNYVVFFCHMVVTLKISCQILWQQIPNSSGLEGAVANSCWALEAIHWFAGHIGSCLCHRSRVFCIKSPFKRRYIYRYIWDYGCICLHGYLDKLSPLYWVKTTYSIFYYLILYTFPLFQ